MLTHSENNNAARLVMSKMVLFNFKSYAGTIEIGPFHKVHTFITLKNTSLFLQLSDPMEVVKVMLLMHCYLYLASRRKKCVKENFRSLSIIQPIIRI